MLTFDDSQTQIADNSALEDLPRRQVAALCLRTGTPGREVLLITSRGTGRWIIPKGWTMSGKSDAEAAMQEAWEEAGVKCHLPTSAPFGRFDYLKTLRNGNAVPVDVAVFLAEVTALADEFPEAGQRKRVWLPPHAAADRVNEPALKQILGRL